MSCFDPDDNTAFYSAYKVTPEQAAELGKYSRNDINVNKWRTPGIFCENVLMPMKYCIAILNFNMIIFLSICILSR